MFSGCTVLLDSKETKLGSSDQELSSSAGKNTRGVLVSCTCMEVRPYSPTATSGGVDISEVPWCHLLQQMSSLRGLKQLIQGLVSHELKAYLSIFNLFKLKEL